MKKYLVEDLSGNVLGCVDSAKEGYKVYIKRYPYLDTKKFKLEFLNNFENYSKPIDKQETNMSVVKIVALKISQMLKEEE